MLLCFLLALAVGLLSLVEYRIDHVAYLHDTVNELVSGLVQDVVTGTGDALTGVQGGVDQVVQAAADASSTLVDAASKR